MDTIRYGICSYATPTDKLVIMYTHNRRSEVIHATEQLLLSQTFFSLLDDDSFSGWLFPKDHCIYYFELPESQFYYGNVEYLLLNFIKNNYNTYVSGSYRLFKLFQYIIPSNNILTVFPNQESVLVRYLKFYDQQDTRYAAYLYRDLDCFNKKKIKNAVKLRDNMLDFIRHYPKTPRIQDHCFIADNTLRKRVFPSFKDNIVMSVV